MASDEQNDQVEDPRVTDLLALWADRAEDAGGRWAEFSAPTDYQVGPGVAELTSRLTTVPGWFLTDPISISALGGDVLGGELTADAAGVAQLIDQRRGDDDVRVAAALALWLWASQEVIGPLSRPLRTDRAATVLAALAFRLAAQVDHRAMVGQSDRRNEFARAFLFWSGQLPAGEDAQAARGQLDGLDSIAHNALLAEALAVQEHRVAVAKQLADARAREAATRYSAE